jgi:proline iminopeptidase
MGTPLATREGYVARPAGRVWYQVVGGGDRVPLVTVHGGPGFPHDYLEPLAALADERPVVFYDQLECGRSDRPNNPSLWHNEYFVDELGHVIEALGLDHLHLLGQSWGTILAVEYALLRPDRVSSLILASPALSMPRYAAGTAALRKELPAAVQAVLDHHEAAGTIDSPEYEAASMEFLRRYLCRLDPWPEPMMRSVAGLNTAVYTTMQGPSEFVITGIHQDYDITGRLGALAMPTLLTCGRYDETRPEETRFYADQLPNSEMVVFEQSAHMAHLEEPEAYLAVIRDFLHRVEAAERWTPSVG